MLTKVRELINKWKELLNEEFSREAAVEEVWNAFRKMKMKKAVRPDGVPVKVWKSLGSLGIQLNYSSNSTIKNSSNNDIRKKASRDFVLKND